MKLKGFLAMMAVAFVATGFTSCDDDDDEVFVHPAAGQYFGENSMFVMGTNDVDPNAVVEMYSETANTIAIKLPESAKQSKAGMQLPSLTIKGLPIAKSANGFDIKLAATDTLRLQAPREDGTKMNITIYDLNGTVAGKDLNLKYTIKMGRMPMPLVDTFKGSKK